ncbi:transposase, partial [Streptomyces sp. NPDC093595]|uniref:transposase n=1 Tax=Streptomyces sp. NPDC093595 TaxID=3366045 RepID=UPI0037FBDB14
TTFSIISTGGPSHTGAEGREPHCEATKTVTGDLQKEPPGGVAVEPDDHGLGRSRGGLTTKLHLAVEQGQKPMSLVVTAGQRGESPQFEAVLGRVQVPRPGPGRPRTRPRRVRADKAYASRKNRAYLRRRGIRCTIPDKTDQARNRKKRGSCGGRPPKFDPRTTRPGTRSNAALIASKETAPWLPDTKTSRSVTRRPSSSRPSTSGYD